MAKLITKTYGEALFELAMEEHCMEQLAEEAAVVISAISQNPELLKLLNHPKIVKEEKISFMESVFRGKVSDPMIGFLILVVQKDRHNEITGILQYFLDEVKEFKKIGVAYVTSAIPLSEAQQEQIKQKLLQTTEYVNYEMHYQVEPELIGGMVIRVGDRVVDSSVRSRIETLAKELTNIQLN